MRVEVTINTSSGLTLDLTPADAREAYVQLRELFKDPKPNGFPEYTTWEQWKAQDIEVQTKRENTVHTESPTENKLQDTIDALLHTVCSNDVEKTHTGGIGSAQFSPSGVPNG